MTEVATAPAPGAADPARWSIAVLHSQQLVADVLGADLSASPALRCVMAASSADRLWDRLSAVDALVLDQRSFDHIAARLRAETSVPALVVLGDDASPDGTGDCLRSLRNGARAWVSPQVSPELLFDAMLTALAGRTWLAPTTGAAIVERLLEFERYGPRLGSLTVREHEVLMHLVAGHGTARMAELMFVSPNTVRSHRTRLFSKLGVHSSLEAVAVARAAGLTR